MCFPLGQESFKQKEAPTEKSLNAVKILRTIFYLQMFLASIELILVLIGFPLSSNFVYDLLAGCVLFMAYTQLSSCNCIFYIVFAVLRLFEGFIFFGSIIQSGENPLGKNAVGHFIFFFIIGSFLFFCFAIVYSVICYKEFKNISENLETYQNLNSKNDFESQKKTNESKFFFFYCYFFFLYFRFCYFNNG